MCDKPTILLVLTSTKGGEWTHITHVTSTLKSHFQFIVISAKKHQPSHSTHSVDWLYSLSPYDMWKLYKIIQKHTVSLIHCHGYRALYMARFLRIIFKNTPPIIGTIHGFHLSHYTSHIKKYSLLFLEKIFCRLQNHLIAVSQSDYNDILKHRCAHPQQLTLIPNGIQYHPTRHLPKNIVNNWLRTHQIDPKSMTIICSIGALEPVKGSLDLVKMAHHLITQYPNQEFRFLIIGSGPLYQSLHTFITDQCLQSSIYLLGHQDSPTDWLNVSDIYLSFSHYEGCPYSILEAMNAQLPVIAPNVSGCKDLIQHNHNGYLFQPKNYEECAQYILTLSKDAAHRIQMGNQHHNILNTTHSLQNMSQQLHQLYHKHLSC